MLAVTGAHEGRRAAAPTPHSSPTAGSRAAPTGSASATSRPRRSTAARSRSSPTVTGSSIDAVAHTIDLLVDDAELERAAQHLEAAGAALHHRVPGEVRQAGAGSRARRDHELLSRARAGDPRGRDRARSSSTRVRSTGTIAKVHAPDAWFLKRGLTPRAVRAALRGPVVHQGAAARQAHPGRHLDGGAVLGLHLGHERARAGRRRGRRRSAPLREQPGRSPAWHRFGVTFADGGSLYLRDPRRLGAVELDPDEDRLGPDAFDLTLRAAARDRHRGAARRSRR